MRGSLVGKKRGSGEKVSRVCFVCQGYTNEVHLSFGSCAVAPRDKDNQNFCIMELGAPCASSLSCDIDMILTVF